MTFVLELVESPGDAPASAGSPAPRCYHAFGGVIRSALEFPELVEASGTDEPQWILEVYESAAPERDLVPLGARQVGPENYSLWRSADGLRLQYSHAGVFDLSDNGRKIIWYRQSDALPELVRSIVLGPALALSLELAGFLCLHGSAVAIEGQAIVFLGPKYHGKSTLATALTAAGAQLVGDDLIAVSPGPSPMLRPGVPSVRLWDDAVGALSVNEICDTLTRGVKTTASGFAERAITSGEISLAALYVLEPKPPADGFTCERRRLTAAAAAIGLAQQTKLADSLIGMSAAGMQLGAAARLATMVPVWTLSTARDLARLPAIVAQIISWHSESPS
jgi:hypothetical protein